LLTSRTTERSLRGRLDATTAACPVFLARQESLERTVNQANLVYPDHPVYPVVHRWRFALNNHRRHASHARRDHPDPLDHLANLAQPDPLDPLEAQARMAEMDHPAHLVHLDRLAHLAKTERRDHPAPRQQASQRPLETKDHPARTAHPVNPDLAERKAQMALLVLLATKAHPARLDHPATMVHQATKARLAQMEVRERRVFAPNIAPPTVVSSSRTEQGDKRSSSLCHRRVYYTDEKPVFLMSIVIVVVVFAVFAFFGFLFVLNIFDDFRYFQKSDGNNKKIVSQYYSTSSTSTSTLGVLSWCVVQKYIIVPI